MERKNKQSPRSWKKLFTWIQQMDEKIMNFSTQRFDWPILEPLMKFFSHPPYWRELMLTLVLILLAFGSVQLRWRLIYLLLTVFLSDQTCNLIKTLVKRIRPDGRCTLEGRSFWRRLGYYSFPSSHAANTLATAFLLSQWWSYLTIPAYLFAILVSFSRVYGNDHYPSDVLAGGLIGLGYGYLVFQFTS